MKRQLLNLFAGKLKFQKYFELLYRISLRGMNFGNGGDYRTSGEYFSASYVKSKLSAKENKLILFDVGANIGNYSLELSNIFKGSDFVIHSFEPSYKTYQSLLEKTKGIPEIHVNNFGFSDTENKSLLFSTGENAGMSSVYQRNLEHFRISMEESEEIKLSTIELYCEKRGISRIHFLKLDIEGHELSALKGASQLIKNKKIDFIQFEFGGCNIDSRTYFQDFWNLLKNNYHIYRIVKDGLFPIINYKETYEIFTVINYLAELKSSSDK